MAITLVQSTGTTSDSATSISLAYVSNVTNGNLLVIGLGEWTSTTNRPAVVGDITQSAGTATLGAFTLDVQNTYQYVTNNFINVMQFSVPVTGTGSCTIQVANMPAGSFSTMSIMEWSGVDTSISRVARTADGVGQNSTVMTTDVANCDGTAVFIGTVHLPAAADDVITEGVDYTLVYENESAAHEVLSTEYRSVTAVTTDAADWTQGSREEWQAVLAVYNGTRPAITTPVANVTVYEGDTALFSVSATTSGGTLHYQWKVNGVNVGSDTNTYTTPATTLSDNRSIVTCDVTDNNGLVTSGGALYVIPTSDLAWTKA